MDDAQGEMEVIKAELEKLTADLYAKSELSDRLKRAFDEQCAKLQEAKLQIEKQARELGEKSDENSSAGQMLADLRLCLHEKESALKHLNATNDQLRASWTEKLATLEGENKELASSLSEANSRAEEHALKISFYEGDLKNLKHLLLESQKKCCDAERRLEATKELKMREDVVMELERQNGKVLEQLKWKIEQFRHLEDAKEKLQEQFQVAKKEWQAEKSSLIEEMCSLQEKLESKTRVADDLSSRLEMCNEALAHEQSRRKMLEIQISDSKATYENVLTEYEEARLTMDKLAASRDDEIASLRNILATKDMLLKESEYRKAYLEQENQELHASLKELREGQMYEAGAACSLKTVRQKLRSLEHTHRECPAILKDKETEWSSQTRKLEMELNDCLSKLNCNAKLIQEFQAELDATHSSVAQLKLENLELSVMFSVLHSKYSEVQSEFEKMLDEVELSTSEKVRRISILKEQLKNKCSALDQAIAEIEREREARKMLLERVEYLEQTEQRCWLVQKELDDHKVMLENISNHVNCVKSLAVDRESSIREELRIMAGALDEANSSLADKERKLNLVNFELDQHKSAVQLLEKSKLEAEDEVRLYHVECQSIKNEFEIAVAARMKAQMAIQQEKGYLLQIIEEKDRKIEDLQQQNSQLEEHFAKKRYQALTQLKLEAEMALKKEKEKSLRIEEDKNKELEDIEKELDHLMHELLRVEIVAEVTLHQDRIHLVQLTKEKEAEIAILKEQMMSLEVEFRESLETTIALELTDKQLEVDALYKKFEKIARAFVVDACELEFEKLVTRSLEDDFDALKKELKFQEEASSDLEKCVAKLCSELEIEKAERERERTQMAEDLHSLRQSERYLKYEIEEFKRNTRQLHVAIEQLSSERNELVLQLDGISDVVAEAICTEDEIRRRWSIIESKTEKAKKSKGQVSGLSCGTKGRSNPSLKNKVRGISDGREPLKECNS